MKGQAVKCIQSTILQPPVWNKSCFLETNVNFKIFDKQNSGFWARYPLRKLNTTEQCPRKYFWIRQIDNNWWWIGKWLSYKNMNGWKKPFLRFLSYLLLVTCPSRAVEHTPAQSCCSHLACGYVQTEYCPWVLRSGSRLAAEHMRSSPTTRTTTLHYITY